MKNVTNLSVGMPCANSNAQLCALFDAKTKTKKQQISAFFFFFFFCCHATTDSCAPGVQPTIAVDSDALSGEFADMTCTTPITM
jgi:hypothetical protein